MIQFKVNRVEHSFDGDADMPLILFDAFHNSPLRTVRLRALEITFTNPGKKVYLQYCRENLTNNT
jgi:hypothetical protein